ncbi:MAG: HEAT repeat domain-containing protein [Candidatus Omnitrophica bacterium]|nr:HEAT repeat domain-containing protein [Candidatus Omnitrophota bacterium]
MMAASQNPVVGFTYDTLRFFGGCVRIAENGFFKAAPFLKPAAGTRKPVAAKSPAATPAPSAYIQSDRVVTTTFPPLKKEAAPEPNPILLSFQNEIQKKPAAAVLQPIEQTVSGDPDAFFRGIPFAEKDEYHRAEIYVRDFDSRLAPMRSEALDQIKKLSKPAAVAILKKLLGTETNAIKQVELLNALSMLNQPGDLDSGYFKGYLGEANPRIRLAALRAISKYKDEEALQILSAAIKDPAGEVRKQALNLICWNYGNRGIPYIMKMLHDVEDSIRKAAIQMCGTFKAQPAISGLITLLADADPDIQKAADAALRKITKQDFDFHPKGSPKHKEEAIEAWRFWWINNQATFGSSGKSNSSISEKNSEVEQGGDLCLKNLY